MKRGSREKSALLPTRGARLPQLLAAVSVEQCELSHVRHLIQQLRVIGAVLGSVTALARVTQLICRSSSETDCSIRRAVASAFSPISSVSVARVAR